MRGFCRSMLVLGVMSMGAQALALNAWGADDVAAKAPPGYSSPQEAFEARRKALARRDWRTAWASLTPAARDAEVLCLGRCWLLVEGGMEGGPFDQPEQGPRSDEEKEAEYEAGMAKLSAVLKKYGLQLPELDTEYNKNYHAKYGVNLAELKAEVRKRQRQRAERYLEKHAGEREVKEFETYRKEHPEAIDEVNLPPGPGEAPDPSLPNVDDDLLDKALETLTSRVANKPAFYEEASEILMARGREAPDSILGDLQGVVASGDSAKGWVVVTYYVTMDGVKKASRSERLQRTFRRLDGRWYNDDMTWDHTRFDPEKERRPANESPTGGGPNR